MADASGTWHRQVAQPRRTTSRKPGLGSGGSAYLIGNCGGLGATHVCNLPHTRPTICDALTASHRPQFHCILPAASQ